MKRFTELFQNLDRTTKTNDKVDLLKTYFLTAPPKDRIWAIALFTGRRPPRSIRTSLIQQWTMEEANIPEWLFRESYHSVGDLAETISLLLPANESTSSRSLCDWFEYFKLLNDADDTEKRKLITDAWKELSPYEIFVFNKLLMGSFRIGVSQTLVVRAIALATETEPAVIAHRVMGSWDPYEITYDDLIHADNSGDQSSKPYPFYLAYAIEGELEDLGLSEEWFAEWKWDGIRSQIIHRNDEMYIWSRGEELITDKFPEFIDAKKSLPQGLVLDGEIVCYTNDKPLPFNILQTRISRKNITKKILQEAPAVFLAYDLLEYEGTDMRYHSHQERRKILERIIPSSGLNNSIYISQLIDFTNWEELKELHLQSRNMAAEGFMLKRKLAQYLVGRKKGDWWKWKVDPLSVDAVMIYAQKGHGRRAELYTDYTFGVWNDDKLIPFAKAYSGLTDEEIRQVDRFVKTHTLEKFGPVRTVKPELVFEIGFEGINASTRHKSGIAVRFPRILRWRKDKTAEEADTLENLTKILKAYY
jgi:DNA ligase-1